MTTPDGGYQVTKPSPLGPLLWGGASCAFVAMSVWYAAPQRPLFEQLDIHLPGLADWVTKFGTEVLTPFCLLMAAAGLGVSFLPWFLVGKTKTAGRAYMAAGLALLVLTAVSFFSVRAPVEKLMQWIGEHAAPQAR